MTEWEDSLTYDQKRRFHNLRDNIFFTLSSRLEGYDDLVDLIRDLDIDGGIEVREEVRTLGFASFDRFLRSSAMADRLKVEEDGERVIYKAKRIDGWNSDQMDEQIKSKKAVEAKAEKERLRALRDGREPVLNGRYSGGLRSAGVASTSRNGGYSNPPQSRPRAAFFGAPPPPVRSMAENTSDEMPARDTSSDSYFGSSQFGHSTTDQFVNSQNPPSNPRQLHNDSWSDFEDVSQEISLISFDGTSNPAHSSAQASSSVSSMQSRFNVPSAMSGFGFRTPSVMSVGTTFSSASRFQTPMTEEQMAHFEERMAEAINGIVKFRHPSTFLADELMEVLNMCNSRCMTYFAQNTGRNLEDVISGYCPNVEVGILGGNIHISWKPSPP